MTPLRTALVGVGRIADMHYLGYAATPKAELVAICDVDPDLLRLRADEWGVEKTYDDFDELLEDPDVDAVDIITPHYLHAPMTIAALEAGKHVSVQKPMALTIAEADAMIDAAERMGKLLRVIDNYRFHPPFVRAKQILESGGIGEPMSVRIKTASGTAPNGWEIPQSSHQWRSDPTLSGEGSVLFDHGHHVWTIARYLLGDIERVFAYIGSTEVVSHHEIVSGGTLDNPGMIVWKYAGRHVYGTCESVHSEELIVRSTHYPIDVSFEITGSRGILYVHQGPERTVGSAAPNGDTPRRINDEHRQSRDSTTPPVSGWQSRTSSVRYRTVARPTSPARKAREVLRFSLAMVRSGREGREVVVADQR